MIIDKLPEWNDCHEAIESGSDMDALAVFIYEYEDADHPELWRERLLAAIQEIQRAERSLNRHD